MARLIAVGVVILLVSVVLTLIIYTIQTQSAKPDRVPRRTLPIAFGFDNLFLQDGQVVKVSGMVEVVVAETAVAHDTTALKILTSEVLETAVRDIAAHKTLAEFQQNAAVLSLKIREASQDALAQKGLAIVSLVVKDIV